MTRGPHRRGLALTMRENNSGEPSPNPSQKVVFALGTVSTEVKGGDYRRGLSTLTRGSCQPKMAERDEHINQGDRSLLPTCGVILCLGGTEAFGSFLSCGTEGWCLLAAGGDTWWRGGSDNRLFYGEEECQSSVF